MSATNEDNNLYASHCQFSQPSPSTIFRSVKKSTNLRQRTNNVRTLSAVDVRSCKNFSLNMEHTIVGIEYKSPLDTILENSAIEPNSPKIIRRSSEPYINSWQYNSTVYIIPVSHPELKRKATLRALPTQYRANETPIKPESFIPKPPKTSTRTRTRSSKHEAISPNKTKPRISATVTSSNEYPLIEKDSIHSIIPHTMSSIPRPKSEDSIPNPSSMFSSSSDSETSVVQPKEHKRKNKKRHSTVERIPINVTHDVQTVDSSTQPRSSEEPHSENNISPISINYKTNSKRFRSVSASPHPTFQKGSGSTESAEKLKKRRSSSRKTKRSSRTSQNTTESDLSDDIDDDSSTHGSPILSRRNRPESPSLSPLLEGISKFKKSPPSFSLDSSSVSPSERSVNNSSSFNIKRSIRVIPDEIWLNNPSSIEQSHSFLVFLKAHLKDSQLCEALIAAHTEIVCSRYLLDQLISAYENNEGSIPAPPPIQKSSSEIIISSSKDQYNKSTSELIIGTPVSGHISPFKTSILNFLKKWVRIGTSDFADDSILQDMLLDFVNSIKRRSNIENQMGNLILDLLYTHIQKLEDDPNSLQIFIPDILFVLSRQNQGYDTYTHLSPSSTTHLSQHSSANSSSFGNFDSTVLSSGRHILSRLIHFPRPLLGRRIVHILSEASSAIEDASLEPCNVNMHLYHSNVLPHLVPASVVSQLQLIDISPIEIARQLTLLDHSGLCQVRSRDLLRFASSPLQCKALSLMIEGFNHYSRWVGVMVLNNDTSKYRARMLSHFIEVAENLLELNSLNALLAIIAGLTQITIAGLRSTWKKVPKKDLKTLHSLQQLTSPLSNFVKLRQHIDSQTPPIVLPPAIFLRDLVMLTESSQNSFFLNGTLEVDTQKATSVEKLLGKLHSSQRAHYQFVPLPPIQAIILSDLSAFPADLESWSLKVESDREI